MIANANYEDLAAAAAAGGQLHAGSAEPVGGAAEKRPYYGKCQYKTGKCFNERTLKRNGDAHSLCEEHRIKQNLIQRRSDRKYQTVHAIRRRERSQRRAVLKKQVSMAVAQQLFYEHQQQKSIGMQQLSAGHSLSTLAPAHGLHQHSHHHHPLHSVASLAPPIQIPGKMDLSHFVSGPASFLSSAEGLASPILSFAAPSSSAAAAAVSSRGFVEEAIEQHDHKMEGNEDVDDEEEGEDEDQEDDDDEQEGSRSHHRSSQPQQQQSRLKQQSTAAANHVKEENASPTGIDDFAPDSFLSICASEEEGDAAYANLVPIMSTMGEKEMWTEDDIEFLQNLLLA